MRILSNNIYWLQGHPAPCIKPNPVSIGILNELQSFYSSLDLDIICLQEIQNSDTFDLLTKNIGKNGIYCPGNTFDWYGGAILSNNVQLINSTITCKDNADRFWAQAQVEYNQSQYKILTLHLPSNLNRDDESATLKRQDELNTILINNSPDIICGDFNQTPNDWLQSKMDDYDYCDAALINADDASPTCTRSGRRIDFIWVKKCHAHKVNSFRAVTNKEFASSTKDRIHISDHLPIILDIDL